MENETEVWDTPDPVKVVALEQAVLAHPITNGTIISFYAESTVAIACRFEQYLRSEPLKL